MFDIFFDLNDIHQIVDNDDDWETGEGWIAGIDYAASGDETIEIKKKNKEFGCNCAKCGDIFPYAEPNQPNGTMICYSCRNFG